MEKKCFSTLVRNGRSLSDLDFRAILTLIGNNKHVDTGVVLNAEHWLIYWYYGNGTSDAGAQRGLSLVILPYDNHLCRSNSLFYPIHCCLSTSLKVSRQLLRSENQPVNPMKAVTTNSSLEVNGWSDQPVNPVLCCLIPLHVHQFVLRTIYIEWRFESRLFERRPW